MKHHSKLKVISSVLLTLCIAIGGVLFLDQSVTLAPDNPTDMSSIVANVKPAKPVSPDTPTDNYTPTKWDPTASPNMYQIHGTAILPEHKPAPGEVIYEYEPVAHHQYVAAMLTYDNLLYGDRDRDSLSNIEPIGWSSNTKSEITFPDGTTYHGWFWNRSHLLGHAIGGEDEEKNLITGTRAQNVGKNDLHGGMQFAETLVHEYLDNHHDGYVYYIVTPVYNTDENIPRSVFVDVQSDDRSIDYHIEVYNAMPGYDINYKTGEIYAK